MKKMICAVSTVALLFLASCASTSRTGVVAPFINTQAHPNEIRADFDLAAENKVTGKAKLRYIMGIRVSGGNAYFEDKSAKKSFLGRRIDKAQSCAMYDALEQGQYDIIVNPQYKNVVHSWFFGLVKRYDVTVTGYGGKVKRLYQHSEPTPYQVIEQK